MAAVDFKVGGVVLGTILMYTLVANVIPQVESDVPEDVAFGADVTPEELVSAGLSLYEGAGGCLACHAESPGARGPNLLTDYQGLGLIGERCEERVPGLNCKEYLYQALVRPLDDMVEGYPPIMPPADRTMTQSQIWALVAFLESAGGEVTVTAADIQATETEVGMDPTGAVAMGPTVAATAPQDIVGEMCVMCHVLNGEGTDLGPPFNQIGARLTPDQIRTAILDPPSFVSPGYEEFVGLMPPTFGQQLNASQLEAVVRYLSDLH